MAVFYNDLRVRVDPERLAHNYRLLQAAGGNAVPVIKADAYGHGLEAAGRALAAAGAPGLAAGTVEECVLLRGMDTGLPADAPVLGLLGPQSAADAEAAAEHRILPFCYREDQLRWLDRVGQRRGRPVDAVLKFDTGMARLGFAADDVDGLLQTLAGLPGVRPVMAASHLATADEPDQAAFVREQGAAFARITKRLRGAGLDVRACLANSAALLAHPELRLDVQRPGIALYGANPFQNTPWQDKGEGLLPAMQVTAPVLQVHALARGRSISYGRTFTAPRDMRVAVVAAGYADCYSRNLSAPDARHAGDDAPCVLLRGRRAPVLGRVCMQMTAVDASHVPDAAPGDRAYLLGGPGPESILPWELAAWWNTITYEVFCVLGLNPKEYGPLD